MAPIYFSIFTVKSVCSVVHLQLQTSCAGIRALLLGPLHWVKAMCVILMLTAFAVLEELSSAQT